MPLYLSARECNSKKVAKCSSVLGRGFASNQQGAYEKALKDANCDNLYFINKYGTSKNCMIGITDCDINSSGQNVCTVTCLAGSKCGDEEH